MNEITSRCGVILFLGRAIEDRPASHRQVDRVGIGGIRNDDRVETCFSPFRRAHLEKGAIAKRLGPDPSDFLSRCIDLKIPQAQNYGKRLQIPRESLAIAPKLADDRAGHVGSATFAPVQNWQRGPRRTASGSGQFYRRGCSQRASAPCCKHRGPKVARIM